MNSLQPEVERRRRLLTRALPLGILAAIGFIAGAIVGQPGSPQSDAAGRFAAAWARGDLAAMYGELSRASRHALSRAAFVRAYRDPAEVATLRAIVAGSPSEPSGGGGATVVTVPVEAVTADFGTIRATLSIPFADGGIAWNRSLVFPGLRPGERLESRIELAPRSPILAADGRPLAVGPAAARRHPIGNAALDVTGELGTAEAADEPALAREGFPPATPVGVDGLEALFNRRLAGRPGGTLLAISPSGTTRALASSRPAPGRPLRTTIDPKLQLAAVEALGGRLGGIAVLDARKGDVRALAGEAFSAPQPPGSTFKIITAAAALDKGIVSMGQRFAVADGATVGGRFISNANGEYCGGTFREAFAESCNADFVPLGPKIGGRDLVAIAQRFGFNAPPALYAPRVLAAANPPPPSIPREIGDELDLGVTAIGQGQVLATPLEMASVAQTISAGGVRQPTPLVLDRDLRPHAAPVRVISRRTAAQVTELMIAVVTSGTGTAAAIPQAQVAGKTGTAELGPAAGQQGARNPKQEVDAWFSAFAPATHAKLAIGVLLANAGAAGGEVAAPVAARVLSAGL